MLSPLEIPLQARVLIVSTSADSCKGVTGLENFEGHQAATQSYRSNVGGATYVNQVQIPTVKVKPQPQTWIHMSTVGWAKKNGTLNIPSYSDGGPNDSETQNKIIEAIQEEQNRVYKQNQILLGKIRNPDSPVRKNYDMDQSDAGEIEESFYNFKQLEDDVIKYLIEKIVAMRE